MAGGSFNLAFVVQIRQTLCMKFKKIHYFFSRLHALGLRATFLTLYRRAAHALFIIRWRRKALRGQAHAKENYDGFGACCQTFAQRVTPHLLTPSFTDHLPQMFQNSQTLFAAADAIANGTIELFGRPYPVIDWGNNNFPTTWKTAFYADIPITWSTNQHAPHHPDVKVPWEYARFNQIFTLGMAYNVACAAGNTERAQRYATTFVAHVSGWLDQTPSMIGITWKCPMDCAIRAINLIYGICFFHQEPTIDAVFWQKLFSSLRNHQHYLEHNLERSDKPNNHLLADQLGLFFLSVFLAPLSRSNNDILKKLKVFVQRLNHQILPDGTAYEGSTAYHRLDTEMVLHALVLCKAYGLECTRLETTFNTMYRFLGECTMAPGQIVQIGDNDSGRIVAGMSTRSPNNSLITYPKFGLSIIRHTNWHITLRHPAFAPHQPTGHFHQDALSFTLAFDGIPFIIDPGSATYTPHGWSRNTFRSISKHNAFFLPDAECDNIPLDAQDLFQLAMPPPSMDSRRPTDSSPRTVANRPLVVRSCPNSVSNHAAKNQSRNFNTITLQAASKSYSHEGVILKRTMIFDTKNEILTIKDNVTSSGQHQHNHNIKWMLHGAPGIAFKKVSGNLWIMIDTRTNTTITIETPCDWECIPTAVSLSYGSQEPSLALTTTCHQNDIGRATLVFRNPGLNT